MAYYVTGHGAYKMTFLCTMKTKNERYVNMNTAAIIIKFL